MEGWSKEERERESVSEGRRAKTHKCMGGYTYSRSKLSMRGVCRVVIHLRRDEEER